MTAERVDIAVVGGGIHGTGVAQAAAAAGYTVALLEKTALAAGTSSRSSKLIHGGLRYLEGGHLGLVRECLRERALLLRLAPGLVALEDFLLPVYRHARRRSWQVGVGLGLYALLAGLGEGAAFSRLRATDPGLPADLRREDLLGAWRYQDGRTDDAALTRAVAASARALGANLMIPAELASARLTAGGVALRYRDGRGGGTLACRLLVNAAGPWVNHVLGRFEPELAAADITLVQGTHIVVPGEVTPTCCYLENPPDGRGIFVLPWRGATLVGTTESAFGGQPDDLRPRRAEIRYLLRALRWFFPGGRRLQPADVEAFAGLRVLPAGAGHAFHKSREVRIVADDEAAPRVLTVAGGKLTAYRATAARVIQRAAPVLPHRRRRADTRRLALVPVPGEALS